MLFRSYTLTLDTAARSLNLPQWLNSIPLPDEGVQSASIAESEPKIAVAPHKVGCGDLGMSAFFREVHGYFRKKLASSWSRIVPPVCDTAGVTSSEPLWDSKSSSTLTFKFR